MTLDKQVLLARFRLNPEALKAYSIAVLEFPYTKAFQEFQNEICQIRGVGNLDWEELPPYRQLNDALVASSPLLIHAFKKKSRYSQNRSMMAFGHLNGRQMWKPSVEQIMRVIRSWAQLWSEQIFPNEMNGMGRQARDRLLESITNSPESDWQQYNALELWKHPNEHDRLGWDAIPNLLAAILVSRQQEITLTDTNGIQRSFKWMLTQDGDKRLAVVSPPLESESERRYAYVGSFSVQTQAGGTNDRWIYLKIGSRRYMDRPVAKVKKVADDVSVMLQVKSPRIEGWELSSTLVSLPASGTPERVQWSNGVHTLLESLNLRPLAEIKDIYQDPIKYFGVNTNADDTYHIVYSEGMKPRHKIKPGIGLQERSEIVNAIIGQMEGILKADIPQPIDETSALSLTEIRNYRDEAKQLQLLTMFTQDDLEDIKLVYGASDFDNMLAKQHLTVEALHRATDDKPLRILILHRTSASREALEKYVKKTLFISDELPSNIEIVCEHIYGDLGNAPNIPEKILWNPAAKSDWKKLNDQRGNDARAAYETKVKQWQEFLESRVHPHGHTLALIEMDGTMDDATIEDEFYKSALRRACVSQGVNSQMIFTVTEKALNTKTNEGREQVSRIKRATNDLLLRWPHVMYGPPSQMYSYAGLTSEVANNLVVVGLYRYRTNGDPFVDIPIAVILMPNGKVKVSLPTEDGIPMSPVGYLDAGPRLGNIFAKYRGRSDKQIINLTRDSKGGKDHSRLARFAAEIISLDLFADSPTLMLMEADGWRTKVIPTLTDPEITKDLLDFSKPAPGYGTYAPSQLPNLRAIRIRDAGNLGETPQYIATMSHDWQSVDDADDEEYIFGVADISVTSALQHYYSIGRRPVSVKESGNDAYLFGEGSDIAHKHQQAIEFVPFFLQDGDDALAWCRIAHFLRSSPAWNGGNIVLPYPLHLAKTLINDEIDVFRPRL